MNWQVKFLKNAMIGLLPFPLTFRKIKRKFFPYPSEIDEWTLEQGIMQVEMLNSAGFGLEGKVLLELGTGWQPTIPLIFMLAGCKKIILIDSQRLLDKQLFCSSAKNLLLYKEKLSARLKIKVSEIERKLNFSICHLNDLFNNLNINYLAPYNILNNDFSNNSIDIITSRAVLEHIQPDSIKKMLKIFKNLLKDTGKMCHIIDNSDHWQHEDKKLSRLNFLKYSDRIFKIISSFNPLDFQNRLRHFEYLKLFEQNGFKIEYDASIADKRALNELKFINVCERYKKVKLEDLAILTSYIVLSKK